MPSSRASAIATCLSIAGMLVVAATTVPASLVSPAALLFVVWACVPYGALWLMPRFTQNPWTIGGAGAAALAVETGVRASVFVFPQGSTAAIALVFSPAIITILAMPIGALAGTAFGWAFTRADILLRPVLTLAAAAVIALIVLAFARPDLLPWTVMARSQSLAAIGEPRVVTGAGRFARTALAVKGSWHDAGDFDAEPGDEIVVADHSGAELIDPSGLSRKAFVPFGGEPGRMWDWNSRLRRVNGAWAVVRTGGGYQPTEVRSIDNQLLWAYHPDADLPPSALVPSDLDQDRRTEFYASTTRSLARLDETGHVVWTRPTALADIVSVVPPDGITPGWVIASEYERKVHVFGQDGTRIAELPWPGAPVVGVLDWTDALLLVVQRPQPIVMSLDGQPRLSIPVTAGMTILQALAIRWAATAAPMLAIVTSARRDVQRWRLEIRDSSMQLVYDEVLDSPPRLLAVRDRSGNATLLISNRGLSALKIK